MAGGDVVGDRHRGIHRTMVGFTVAGDRVWLGKGTGCGMH